MKNWSKYQLAVFENVANGTGHTCVNAVAGSGKTTTIEEAVSHVPVGCSTMFVAFNKSIADELGRRMAGKPVEVSTLHSYGLRTITSALGRLRIEGRRLDNMIERIHGNARNTFELRRDLAKTVSLAKGALASTEKQIDAIIDGFSIDSALGRRSAFIADVLTLLAACEDTTDGTIDFDDMIWLPVVRNLPQRKFDRLFVDETQDLNAAQIELVLRAVTAEGRICAVGDPRQAIYRFRGADDKAFENVRERLSATELPLSVCYRCSRAVVSEAKKIVENIEAAPDAPEGEVTFASKERMLKEAAPGDFILSRSNAPLIGICMTFLKQGRRATIQGRDIGASLVTFIKKSKSDTVEELLEYVAEWLEEECHRLAQKNLDTQAAEDRAECIVALCDGAQSVADVVSYVEDLFSDKGDSASITLSTTHKAKGLERERVWLLAETYRRRPEIEESNLYYVAVTRARRTLYLVSGFGKKVSRGE